MKGLSPAINICIIFYFIRLKLRKLTKKGGNITHQFLLFTKNSTDWKAMHVSWFVTKIAAIAAISEVSTQEEMRRVCARRRSLCSPLISSAPRKRSFLRTVWCFSSAAAPSFEIHCFIKPLFSFCFCFLFWSRIFDSEDYLSWLFWNLKKKVCLGTKSFEAGDDFGRFGAQWGPGARHKPGGIGLFWPVSIQHSGRWVYCWLH